MMSTQLRPTLVPPPVPSPASGGGLGWGTMQRDEIFVMAEAGVMTAWIAVIDIMLPKRW